MLCAAVGSDGHAFIGPGNALTGSHAIVSVPRPGHARLSFSLAAGNTTGAIHTITITLPGGMAFSSSSPRPATGIAVTAGAGDQNAVLVRASHLTITLAKPAANIQVTISRPVLKLTQAFAYDVLAGKVTQLPVHLLVTTTGQRTTRMTLDSAAN